MAETKTCANPYISRRREKEASGIQGAIRALKLEGRLTESKYKRSLAALLRPPQKPPDPSLPILVKTFSDNSSVAPFKVTGEKESNETTASLARSGFRVRPWMQ